MSQFLGLEAARAAFPQIVGEIAGAVMIDQRRAVLFQGPRAFTAVVDGKFVACCPTLRHAEKAAMSAVLS